MSMNRNLRALVEESSYDRLDSYQAAKNGAIKTFKDYLGVDVGDRYKGDLRDKYDELHLMIHSWLRKNERELTLAVDPELRLNKRTGSSVFR
jgi:hypothetical protein